MLYRLMGRAVFAVAHRIVCEDKDARDLHQSRKPDRRPCVVAKDEEGRPESAELREREPVYSCSHRMLPNAEMQIFSRRVIGLEVSRALIREGSLVRRSEIRRTPEEPGYVLSKNVQRLTRSVPSRDPLGIGWKDGKVAIPTGRQFAPLHQLDLVSELGIFRSISGEEFGPLPPRISPARSYSGSKMLIDAVGHKELRVLGPAVSANGINVVIKNLKAGPVVTIGQPLLGNAHSYARRNALSEWTGRRFNA